MKELTKLIEEAKKSTTGYAEYIDAWVELKDGVPIYGFFGEECGASVLQDYLKSLDYLN